jgi:hypothetical protein
VFSLRHGPEFLAEDGPARGRLDGRSYAYKGKVWKEKTMGRASHDRLDTSAPRTVHEEYLHDRTNAGFEKSLAQRGRIGDADAEVFHQPSWPRS